ncbi:MAG TPA: hypothetical protein VK034_00470, partial [Enhygromyxa sp.]|nr:hypothetical protein [Enhygromyxa sp.]
MRARASASRLGGPRSWVWLLVALWLWLAVGSSLAAPPPSGDGEGDGAAVEGGGSGEPASPPEPSAESRTELEQARVDRLLTKAAHIRALSVGELDPAIELAELLTLDLREPECGQLRAMLEAVDQGRAARVEAERAAAEAAASRRRRPPAEPITLPEPPPPASPDADPLTRAQTELLRAHWQFWTLPAEQRARLIADHQARREAIAERLGAEAAAKVRLARMQREAKQLAALIDGELDVAVDPAPLMRINLAAVDELASDRRLARALAGDREDSTGDAPPAESELAPELAASLASAAAELDAQRLRFAGLGPDQRKAVLERHAARQREAEDQIAAAELVETDEQIVTKVEEELTSAVDKAEQAKREREQAQAAAALARSEALRRVAEERARLLGVKEAHANYEVELATRKKQTLAAHEIALEWDRRIAELAQQRPGSERERQADALYGDLRAALADARERLRTSLDSIAESESGVAPVGDPLSGLPVDVELDELAALRAELEQSELVLRAQEREIVWAAADGGRDDIVMLNHARLILLDLASEDLRDRMTGFGVDGVT